MSEKSQRPIRSVLLATTTYPELKNEVQRVATDEGLTLSRFVEEVLRQELRKRGVSIQLQRRETVVIV